MVDYIFVFALDFILNLIPIISPPTWMVLSFFYSTNNLFNPLILAFGGAISSTIGRFIMAHYGVFFNKYLHRERKESLELVKKVVKEEPEKTFWANVVIALSPLSSSPYFIALGLAKITHLSVFLGFFVGRFILYYISLLIIPSAISNGDSLFTQWHSPGAIFIAGLSILLAIFFLMIDWKKLFAEKKIRLIHFKLE